MEKRNSRCRALVAASLIAFVVPVAAVLAVPQTAGAVTTFQINTTSLPGVTVGQSYSQQIQVSGGVPPYSFFIGEGYDFPLPPGLSMSDSGLISGTAGALPVNQPTTYSIQVNVTDSPPYPVPAAQIVKELSITVTPVGYVPPPPLVISTTSIPDATFNQKYSFQMEASGGTAPYTWSATNLPQGFSMSLSGVISGQNTLPEQGTFTVDATDSGLVYTNLYGVNSSSQQAVAQNFTFTVTSGYPKLDPTLFELSALLLKGGGGSTSIVAELEKLLSEYSLTHIEQDIGNLLCDLTPVNGGLGCILGGLP
jgi:hypothetical protein